VVDAGPSASTQPGPGPTPPRRGALGSYRGGQQQPRPPVTAQPPQPAPADALATPPPTTPPATGGTDLPTRDELTKAWGDEILARLRGRTRALYAAGRFTAVEDGHAVFALPDPNHRDQCAATQADVEAALASHFGRPVPLKLITDTGGTAPAPQAGGRPRHDEPEDDVTDFADIADLPTAPPPNLASPTDRIKSAFPGAEEVE
jgi:hypothetical protein